MTDQPPSTSKFLGIFRRKQDPLFQPWDEARKLEAAAGLEVLKERRKEEAAQRRLKSVIAMWPVGVGLLLSAVSPHLLRSAAQVFGPWGVTVLFPFAVLAERPELQVGPITHFLPTFMLYAQFPIEGLLARIILRRPVLPISVTGQVLLFHFLGIVEVWMLHGPGTTPLIN